jgi:serine-type D-Ala-D-Ala carboxypeptidase/endopeptidase (penicillin-binding protein 4)
MRLSLTVFPLVVLITSCSVSKQLAKSAQAMVLQDSALVNAHVGISVYDPSTGKYLYDYQGDKYFVPASNTKLPTCYAAMKYLGDSLPGIKYAIGTGIVIREPIDLLVLEPTGDPSFLQEDFASQPVFEFLKTKLVKENYRLAIMDTAWKDQALGSGWSWSDFEADYMAERNSFPVFGNVLNVKVDEKTGMLKTQSPYFDSIVNRENVSLWGQWPTRIRLSRKLGTNDFLIQTATRPLTSQKITFATEGSQSTAKVLQYAFQSNNFGRVVLNDREQQVYENEVTPGQAELFGITNWKTLYSRPTDSLLKIMMHRSDNFFAEQSLLMVSNQRLGIMNDASTIDTLLKTDLKDLPQPPRWVDGSGLSRYNLFSPRDFVTILNKMKNEFGMDRLKTILATGNEGTLEGLYIKDSGYIFAKTGTLSGVVALSGFVYTNKNKLLIFSMLVNNHRGSATPVRKAYQKFIQEIRERY